MPDRPIPLLLASLFIALAGPAAAQHPPLGATVSPHRKPAIAPVDINSASRDELMTLPGIGKAEADRIVKARPYPSKAKLVADNVISAPLYDSLKGRIIALQPPNTAASKPKTSAKASAKP